MVLILTSKVLEIIIRLPTNVLALGVIHTAYASQFPQAASCLSASYPYGTGILIDEAQ
jgi:hypothetical protein